MTVPIPPMSASEIAEMCVSLLGKYTISLVSVTPVERIGDQWPDAVSDGLVLPCAICNQPVSFDFRVSDDAWQSTVPDSMKTGVLCLPCFFGLKPENAEALAGGVQNIQFTLPGVTIVLAPQKIYTYSVKECDL